MGDVDFDVDEDVEAGDCGGVDGDEAAVAVVDEKVGAEGGGSEVVDAASAVGNVAEDVAVGDGGEGGEDVGEGERVHEEALRELECHALCSAGEYTPNALVDLEVVVRREHGDCGVQNRIVKD